MTRPPADGGSDGGGLRRAALVGALWSGAEKWAARLLSTAVFIVLARLLDPAAFGLVALGSAIVEVTERLREQGLSLALVQKAEITDREVHSAFWTSIGLGVLFGGLLAALAVPLALLLGEPELGPVVQWLAVGFLIGAVGRIPNALVLRRLEFRAIALRGILANTIAGAVAIVLAFNGAGVWALVTQNLLQATVTSVVLVIAARYRPRAVFAAADVRGLWGVGSRVLGFDLVSLAGRRGDDLILGVFLGPVALGYYTIAYRLLEVLTDTLVRTVQQVVLPTFSRMQDDRERLGRGFITATQLTLTLAMPAALGIGVLAPEIVSLVFGPRWAPSVPAMQWLCVVAALHCIDYFAYDVLLAVGKAGLRLRLLAVRAVVSLVAFGLAAATGDFVAVAASRAIVTIVFIPVSLLVLHRVVPLDRRALASATLPIAAASGAMVLVTELVRRSLGASDVWTIVVCIAVGVASYLVVLVALGRRQLRELRDAASLVRGR